MAQGRSKQIDEDNADVPPPFPRLKRGQRLPGGVANPIDIHVGSRLRLRRTLLGMSQEKLGESVGLTFQQIQKYERGANRVGASRLFQFSQVLQVPIGFFFEDLPQEMATPAGQRAAGLAEQPQDHIADDPLQKRETLELVRAYYRISDPAVRRQLFELAKTLSKTTPGRPGEEDMD